MHFELEKRSSPSFYYAYETDEDGVFARCFWADVESMSSYVYFGDVVVFDTTYNTNKYSMIFAPFVGVNYHRQTTVFGCGLLSDEKIDSFIWLFLKFVEAMPTQRAPGVIITDQDAAIARAVGEVFPNTIHRFCLCHILNKFLEKMSPVLYKEMYHGLVSIIKQSESTEEFESRWADVMETTNLGDNEWLANMYKIRSRWVPAYVKHIFSAGMSSSQRSESNHAFFKRYVNKTDTLMDFITQFSSALAHQRHSELVANHTDLNEMPHMITTFAMKTQMTRIYTKRIFLLFQEELAQSSYYVLSRKLAYEGVKMYIVTRFHTQKIHHRQRELTYVRAIDFIACSCKTFDFEGYPCRHMLAFMLRKQVMLLPDQYIVGRWTQNAKATPVFEPTTTPMGGQSLISRHGMLAHTAAELVDEGALTNARTSLIMDGFQNLKIQVKALDNGGKVGMSKVISKSSEGAQLVVDPTPIRTKGCGKRLKSSKEIAMSQSKRNCRVCGRSGHDKRTCPTLQSRSHLVDEPYHPQYSWDNTQEDRYTGIASSDYGTFNGFDDDDDH